MLYLHEVHQVIGEHESAFEASWRDVFMPALASDGDARLCWYLNHAHGSGPAYNVVTITAVRDGAAYGRLTDRLRTGDLAEWYRSVSSQRHHVEAKMLLPVDWSPLQDVDLATVPTDGAEHDLTLYMEDTGWPSAPLDDYIAFWDVEYFRVMRDQARAHPILEIEACFQVAHGTGYRPEAILVQRIVDNVMLQGLIAEPEEYDPSVWPGSYMHGGLELRDQWNSRLLRTSRWSPLH